MNKITKIYKELLGVANFLHLKVHHKPRQTQLGELDLHKHQITLAKQNKNTLLGCFILAHEIGHYTDFISGKFRRFFLAPAHQGLTDNPKNRKLIENAEWSAIKFARNLLRSQGFRISNREWLDRSLFRRRLLPVWYAQYTKPQKRKK